MGNQWCAGRPPKVKAHEQEYKPGNDNAQDAENPKKYVEKNGVKLKDELKTVDQKVRKEIDNMDGKKVDTLDCPGVKKIVNEMDEKKPDSTVDVVDGPKIRKYAADKIYGKEIECPNGSKKVGKVDAKKVDETGRVVFIVKTVIEVPRSVVKKELQEVGKETILLPANKELVSVLQPPQVLQNQNKVADLHSDGLLGLGGAGATKAAAPSAGNGISAMMESFAKSSLAARQTQRNQLTQAQVTSSTTQMVSSSTTSTSTESSTSSTSSHRLHHLAASERKASSMKSDLSDFKNSISEMKIISNEAALNFTPELPSRAFTSLRKSMEDLADAADPEGDMPEPLVTFPDGDTPPPRDARCPLSALDTTTGQQLLSSHNSKVHVSSSASKTKFSAQEASANSVQRLQLNTFKQDNRSMKVGELSQQEATMKVQTDSYSSKQQATAQQARQTVSSSGLFSSQEKHVAQSSTTTITSKGMCTKSSVISEASQISQLMNGSAMEDELSNFTFDDLDMLCAESSPNEVEMAITRYSSRLDAFVQRLGKASGADMAVSATRDIGKLNEIIRRAWAVPTYGHKLGYSLCNTLRNCGGLDLLMNNCMNNENRNIQFSWAQLLEQCLITENRDYVVEKGLDRAVKVACACTKKANSVDHSRVGTGILEHLFKHSEGTCSDVIKLGGLDAVLFECRKNDVETLRHCAGALANLSLYGGADNQEAMIMRKVPMWLFPLAFHNDDNIKYYACLAIAVLVANTEIEADVLQSGTLNLVEPFVTSHNPSEFARSNEAHAHGQSKNWLQRLVPVLSSKREEARNLAAFHFCMEAGIKKQQGKTEIFREIGAIEPLKKVASCPNAVASKYAVQALRLIGEEIPHKLSQKVPQWSTEDVQEWVKQIGFGSYANIFGESQVDGDLLLQLNEDNLRNDIGLTNGIRRQRFHRELQNLKRMADYSSCDPGNLNVFLQNIGVEFSSYAYSMLNAGVDKETLQELTEEQLENECGIKNSIHRQHILNSIRVSLNNMKELRQDSHNKLLDVFVSYRRSNGSQLASLLKVHLQLRGFTVFIDVERLEAGKFDNNLLESIRQAKHFLLVLTPNSLDRCVKDTECKDWVHREIVAALQSQCNIIPITDNFNWPEAEELPEDMRQVCHFNGVHWVHDYQDACVDKLERFMRGEALGRPALGGKGAGNPPATPAPAPRAPPVYQRMASSDSGKGSDKDQSNGGTRD